MTDEEFMSLKPGDIVVANFIENKKEYLVICSKPTLEDVYKKEYYIVKCFGQYKGESINFSMSCVSSHSYDLFLRS